MNLNKKINGWFVTLVIGLLITGLGYLPLSMNATQQCPENSTTMQDGTNCIIGAPIGPPIWSIGLVVSLIGAVGTIKTLKKNR